MEKGIDEITVSGKRYISVKRAATLAEYTTDYVGQLCRGDKIEATRIGRNWYVEENSLIEHKQSQLDQNTDEIQKKVQKSVFKRRNVFKSSFIIYSKDDRPLFPKLEVKEIKTTRIAIEDESSEIIQVPDSIFTKTSAKLEQAAKNTVNLFSIPRTIFLFGSVFIVSMAVFSLNTAYTFNLLDKGTKSLTTAVLNTGFGQTVDEEIFDPFRLVAKEINMKVDETVYALLYEDILYNE